MILPIYRHFNYLQPRQWREEVFSANYRKRIFVNMEFLKACLNPGDVEELFSTWGVCLDTLSCINESGVWFIFTNYREIKWGGGHYYPDIILVTYNKYLTGLTEIGLREKSVEEVKDRVRKWIFNVVVPFYLECLFKP